MSIFGTVPELNDQLALLLVEDEEGGWRAVLKVTTAGATFSYDLDRSDLLRAVMTGVIALPQAKPDDKDPRPGAPGSAAIGRMRAVELGARLAAVKLKARVSALARLVWRKA